MVRRPGTSSPQGRAFNSYQMAVPGKFNLTKFMKKSLYTFLLLITLIYAGLAQTSIKGTVFNVRDFGAKGDGVTSDQTAVAATITAIVAAGGGTVKFPKGTYLVTGLTVPGGVTLLGDGRSTTTIKSTTNATILNLVVGSGFWLFRGPTVKNLSVQGSSSGASQIGINIDDPTYFQDVTVEDVTVDATGSHGVYFGNVFSSSFKRITSGNSLAGYPFLFNQLNMPGNTFEGLYAGDVNSTSPAGFRIRSGNITCWGCNGINVSSSNSWWAIVGDKTGTDGALSNRSAYFTCNDCNIESSKAGGILHYYNSSSILDGRTEFSGDSGSSGTYIALKYEIDTAGGLIPSNFPKGRLGPLVVFSNSPLSYYANSEVIHANDLPPVTIEGQVRQADGTLIATYRNTTNSRSEKVYRIDSAKPIQTITASTSYSEPGATNYETNCPSLPCTLTLPWAGYYDTNEQLIYIRNIGSVAATITANSGGTVNSGTYTLAVGESALFIPHSASADYRLVGLGGAGSPTRIPYFDGTQHLTSSANLTYDGTTLLNQKAGGNPYFAANDTTNSITTRFGPIAGAPDRAIIGTTSNHPFGLWMNNAERWTINTSGHFVPASGTTYNIGSASLPVNDLTLAGKLYWTGSTVLDFAGSNSPEGAITAGIGSVYRRTNGGSGTTLYVKESGTGNTGWTAIVSSGNVTGTGANGRVTFWTGTSTVSSDSTFIWDNTSKRLGIGTSSPGLPLDVVADGSALAQQWREAGAGTARVQLQIPSSYGQIGTSSNHAFALITNGTQRVNVEATGATVFGSIVPATGTVMSNAIANTDVAIVGNNASGSTTDILKLQVAGSNRYRFLSTGAATFGLASTASGTLTFANSSNANTLTLQPGATASNLTFTLPTADGSSGQCLQTNGSGVLSFASCGGSASLTATYIGYGNGSNVLTGSANHTWDETNKIETLTSASTAFLRLAAGSTASGVQVNYGLSGTGAIHPGSGGGFLLPLVGGSQSSGPGIWWTNNAYNATAGLWISNGLNWQGHSSSGSPLKIRTGTGTSSDGTVRFTLAPDSSLFTQNASTSATSSNTDVEVVDLVSTGTAAASFGAGRLYTLENGSGSQVNAMRLAVRWATATAGSETTTTVIANNNSGLGLGESFTIQADQYYGVYTSANITGGATINFNNGNVQELTLTGNVTSTTLSNLKEGAIYFIVFKQDATGSRTLASSNIKVTGGSLALTATANARDLFQCAAIGTNLYCSKALDVK